MVSSQLKQDIINHLSAVTGVVKKYPGLRFLDEFITKEVADCGRETVRKNSKSGTYGLLWLMRCIMFNVTFVAGIADGKRRVSARRLLCTLPCASTDNRTRRRRECVRTRPTKLCCAPITASCSGAS